jgi:MFS family permease
VAGDQLARVAITVLVYDRTRSPFWTALTYAVTLLPWLVGGLVLAGLADRLPRRRVMVACDIARLILVCLMGLVTLIASAEAALWIIVALLFVVTLLDSPFKSARSAMMPDILTGERYVLGAAVTQTTLQVAMVSTSGGHSLGLRAGRAGHGPPGRSGRLANRRGQPPRIAGGSDRHGARVRRRAFRHGGRRGRGRALGRAGGQAALDGPMAVGAGGVMVLCALQPGLIAGLLIIAVSGACVSYQLAANTAFVGVVPPERRGQAFGLANGGMQVGQGLWIVLAGALATSKAFTPADAIAICGGLGAVLAAALAMSWRSQPVEPPTRP